MKRKITATLEHFIRKEDLMSTIELTQTVYSQIKDIENVELLVLKGHLIIEYLMNTALDKLFYEPILTDERLTFYHKLRICTALGIFSGNEDTLEQIKVFNEIRNKIAHSLDFDRASLNKLFALCPDQVKEYKHLKREHTKNLKILKSILVTIGIGIYVNVKIRIAINNELLNQKLDSDIVKVFLNLIDAQKEEMANTDREYKALRQQQKKDKETLREKKALLRKLKSKQNH